MTEPAPAPTAEHAALVEHPATVVPAGSSAGEAIAVLARRFGFALAAALLAVATAYLNQLADRIGHVQRQVDQVPAQVSSQVGAQLGPPVDQLQTQLHDLGAQVGAIPTDAPSQLPMPAPQVTVNNRVPAPAAPAPAALATTAPAPSPAPSSTGPAPAPCPYTGALSGLCPRP